MNQDVLTSETMLLTMVKEDPRHAHEAVYIMEGSRNPDGEIHFRVVHSRSAELLDWAIERPKVEVSENPIDERTVRALEQAWSKVTMGARWPQGEAARQLPKWAAANYTFDYGGDEGYGQGRTESPDRGTCTAALTQLGELLIMFADEPNEENRRWIREEIRKGSRALSEKLKAWKD